MIVLATVTVSITKIKTCISYTLPAIYIYMHTMLDNSMFYLMQSSTTNSISPPPPPTLEILFKSFQSNGIII